MRVPTRSPRRYTRSLRGQTQAEPDGTFRHGMDSFADRDSVATTEDVYRSVPGYDPRAKAEELARAGNTIDVWAQIGVQLQRDPQASDWAHDTAAVAHENAARRWREHASQEESLVGREVDEREAGYHESAAHAIRERR